MSPVTQPNLFPPEQPPLPHTCRYGTSALLAAKQSPIPDLQAIPQRLRPFTPLLDPIRHSSDIRLHILRCIRSSHDGNIDAQQQIRLLLLEADHGHFDPGKFGEDGRWLGDRNGKGGVEVVGGREKACDVWRLCGGDEVAERVGTVEGGRWC